LLLFISVRNDQHTYLVKKPTPHLNCADELPNKVTVH